MARLNEEQTNCLRSCIAGHNVLVTGQCGTGKTHLMRDIIAALAKTKKVAIVSTTGVSSLQLGKGDTVHRWAGLGDGRHSVPELLELFESDVRYVEPRGRIISSDIIVLDEIGMLSQKTFETFEEVCRIIRGNGIIFGGLQVIASGDFLQLPPVPNLRYGDDGSFCFESDIFQHAFPHHIQLTIVVRQNEKDLAKAIHELCLGSPSEKTEQLMKELDRPITTEREATVIYSKKFDVDCHNMGELEQMEGNMYQYEAIDNGDRKLLRKSPAKRRLHLKPNAPVILMKTINATLVNGMRATIHKLEADGPTIRVGESFHKLDRFNFDVYDPTKEKTLCSRKQFPLNLAFAISIHRAQGLTIHPLIVDCIDAFAPGQIGVAVGRAKSKDGLQVRNYSSASGNLKHPQQVIDFLERGSVTFRNDTSCCRAHRVDASTCRSTTSVSLPTTSMPILDTPDAVKALYRMPNDELDTCSYSLLEFADINKDAPFMEYISKSCLQSEQMLRHVQYIYSVLMDIMSTVETSSDWSQFFRHVNTFIITTDHIMSACRAFDVESITKQQNKFSTKLVMWMYSKLIEERATSAASVSTAASPITVPTGPAYEAKIRYLAGTCVHKIRTRLIESVERKLEARGKGLVLRRKADYQKQKLLAGLRMSDAEARNVASQYTMEEIEFKQGATRGLMVVNDKTFSFFLKLATKLFEVLNVQSFSTNLDRIHSLARTTFASDQQIVQAWLDIFEDECASELQSDDSDILLSHLFDLLNAVSEHFLRIALVEGLHHFKDNIRVKKSQALRTKLTALTEADKKTETSELKECVSTCPECNEVCLSEEELEFSDDNSVGCDSCNMWTHYKCTGMNRRELKKMQACEQPFFCKNCKRGGKRRNTKDSSACGKKGKGRGKKTPRGGKK